MRSIFLSLISLLFIHINCNAQNKPGYLKESSKYIFFSHYWFNMHHLLQQEALMNTVLDSSVVSESEKSKMAQDDIELLTQSVAYYKSNLVELDLRMSDYMSDFKIWVILQSEDTLTNVPDQFRQQVEVLRQFDPVYKKYFWSLHNEQNRKILMSNLEMIEGSEDTIANRLAVLTRSYWQDEKIRVDISYFAKSDKYNTKNRPYTSIEPVHVVMNSYEGSDLPRGKWLEMLYHESSHNLIGSFTGFVAGTIIDVSNNLEVDTPRGLWHAYLFYFSGRVTQDYLRSIGYEDYELYMVYERVFRFYYPYLDQYLANYYEGEITLHNASLEIVSNYWKDRK